MRLRDKELWKKGRNDFPVYPLFVPILFDFISLFYFIIVYLIIVLNVSYLTCVYVSRRTGSLSVYM